MYQVQLHYMGNTTTIVLFRGVRGVSLCGFHCLVSDVRWICVHHMSIGLGLMIPINNNRWVMPANSKSILIKFVSIGRGLNKTSLILVDQGVIEFVSNPKSFIDNKDVGQSGFLAFCSGGECVSKLQHHYCGWHCRRSLLYMREGVKSTRMCQYEIQVHTHCCASEVQGVVE